MSLRLVEIFLPVEKEQSLFAKLESFPAITVVQRETSADLLHTKLIILIIASKRWTS